MSIYYTKYRFTAPNVFNGELIITYKRGYLHQMEGLKYIGNQWDTICINKAIPYREHEIQRVIKEHGGQIHYKKLKHSPKKSTARQLSEAI